MRWMRLVNSSLLVTAVVAVAAAGPPRIVKKTFADAVFLTSLRAATYTPDGRDVLANYKVRLRTETRCDVPSCAGGDFPAWDLKVRCRPTDPGRCPGKSAAGPLTAFVVDFEDYFGPWDVEFELTWDTGTVCRFEGRDEFGYPAQGYVIGLTGTYACEDAGGAPSEAGRFRMGMALPVLGPWSGPLRPQRPNRSP